MVPTHICCLLKHGGWLLTPLILVTGIELMCIQPITIKVTNMSVAAGVLLRQNVRKFYSFSNTSIVILEGQPPDGWRWWEVAHHSQCLIILRTK